MTPPTLPLRRPGVTVAGDDDPTLTDARGGPVCRLNDSALAIWELCDGATTPAEMADAIVRLCSIEPDRALDDVGATIAALDAHGAILWVEAPGAGAPGDRSRKEAPWSPSST